MLAYLTVAPGDSTAVNVTGAETSISMRLARGMTGSGGEDKNAMAAQIDFDGIGTVDFDDLFLFASSFGVILPSPQATERTRRQNRQASGSYSPRWFLTCAQETFSTALVPPAGSNS